MSSGAQFEVLKTAPAGPVRNRLLAQATWLQRHKDPGIVRVTRTLLDGYAMELLHTGDDAVYATDSRKVDAIINILARCVWNRPAPVMEWPHFKDYLAALDYRTDSKFLTSWLEEIHELRVPMRDTHGDPTLENLLWRDRRVPVLVDPLPDAVLRGKMPPLRAVDLGKILQSALNYERVKRGEAQSWSWNSNIAYTVRETCSDTHEWELACFFAAVHVARFIPYQSSADEMRWRVWFPNIVECLRG